MVFRAAPLSNAGKVLKPCDVLLEIDGKAIAPDGTVEFRDRERVSCAHVYKSKYIGDEVQLVYSRDGKIIKDTIKADIAEYLVPDHLWDKKTSYYIYAGLVFTILSVPYVNTISKSYYARFRKFLNRFKEKPNEQVVVLASVLVSDVNYGYQGCLRSVVSEINDTSINNLGHMVELITSSSKPILKISLDDGRVMFINNEEASRTHEGILRENRVDADMSEDMRPHNKNDEKTKQTDPELSRTKRQRIAEGKEAR
mmetsp:Transcript_7364/g.17959  ORF Transcript_7364/g.17959 Transcript_7364/m.17959 type:complete len:255 (+) Transcript_7364:2-766(+)